MGIQDGRDDQQGGSGASAVPDVATMKKLCVWQRLKYYIIPFVATVLILLIAGAIGAVTNSAFFTGLAKRWPVILVVALVVTAVGVVLSSKVEGMYNELTDIKYTMKGLHEVLEWQMSILKTVGKVVDKTEPQIERTREFMDSWKQSMGPMMEEMKRVLHKIENPIAEGVHEVEKGLVAAERSVEKCFVAAERGIERLFHKDPITSGDRRSRASCSTSSSASTRTRTTPRQHSNWVTGCPGGELCLPAKSAICPF